MEIESALKELPLQEAQAISQWLQEYLYQERGPEPGSLRPEPVRLPDYAVRRRMIFGEKVLPNMVLLAREEERW